MNELKIFNIALESWGCLFCFVAAIIILISFKNTLAKDVLAKLLLTLLLVDSVLLLSDIFALLYRGVEGETARIILICSNFLSFALTPVMLLIFSFYVREIIGALSYINKWLWVLSFLSLLYVLSLIFSQFNHMYYYIDDDNIYHRNTWFFLTQVYGLIGIISNSIIILLNKKKLTRINYFSLLIYTFLPIIALIIQLLLYGIPLLNISITFSLLIMYVALEISIVRTKENQALELYDRRQQVDEMRINIMLSQIQPHFIYNSLNAIYTLCGRSPAQAQYAISNFADYLRVNLDSIKSTTPIPFSKELEHVKNYLSLEKIRFEENLQVKYEIKDTSFYLPSLSLQPIVENAVKYGVGKKIGGGTVLIKTEETEDAHYIYVIDDGAGFDINQKKDDGRTHIGIDNVKTRLESMSNGSLKINSKLGEGTKAIIKIPK